MFSTGFLGFEKIKKIQHINKGKPSIIKLLLKEVGK